MCQDTLYIYIEKQLGSNDKLTNRKKKLINAYDNALKRELRQKQIENATKNADMDEDEDEDIDDIPSYINRSDNDINNNDNNDDSGDIIGNDIGGNGVNDGLNNNNCDIKLDDISDILEFPPGLERPIHLSKPKGIFNRNIFSNRHEYININNIVHLLDESYIKQYNIYIPRIINPIGLPKPNVIQTPQRNTINNNNNVIQFDPLNPVNPGYNFIRQKTSHKPIHSKSNIIPTNINSNNNIHISNTNNSIPSNVLKKPKHKLELIIDDKMKSLMPSSLLIKRQKIKPKKKKKVRLRNIAPDIDTTSINNKTSNDISINDINSISNNNNNNNNLKSTDTAYNEFMNDLKDLL